MLKLVGISKSFHDASGSITVLTGVDLEVSPGEFVCLYGASGSGKSTLLNIAAGLEAPDSGSVLVDGIDLSHASESVRAGLRLRRVGVVFQRDNLLPELCAWENVALPLLGQGVGIRQARSQAQSALDVVGVGQLAERAPERLSGGERQRIGIARGVVGDRRLLIADEPTGALDTTNSIALFELLRDLASSSGVAIVVATHDPLAMSIATRVLTIRGGRVDAD